MIWGNTRYRKMRYHLLPTRRVVKCIYFNAGEDMYKLQHSTITGKNINGSTTLEKLGGTFVKFHMSLINGQAISRK